MAYKPLYKVLAWLPDDHTGAGTEITITSGFVEPDMYAPIRVARFNLPEESGPGPDDYDPAEYLVRGAFIEIQIAKDGDFAGGNVKTILEGTIKTVTPEPGESEGGVNQVIEVECGDRMQKAQGNGVNMSRQTRMLVLDIEFDSADFNSDDPNFMVDIPTDSLSQGYEFVPHMLWGLKCTYTRSGEVTTDEYTNGEDYGYAAGSKQIYFKTDQTDQKVDGTWTGQLYYYDPTDLSNTVKEVLEEIATGDPWSPEGGLGFDPGDVELDEIYGFGSNPKVIRSVVWEKVDGPITQLLDALRDSGILPRNYWLRVDPEDGKLKGSLVFQEEDLSSVPVPANGVLDYSNATTIQGVYGRVEVYSKALTPINYAREGSVSINVPTDYSEVLSGADGSEIIDGRPDTVCNFQRTGALGANYEPRKTDVDAWVIDLGEAQPVRTVMFRGAQPIDEGWNPPQAHPLYFITRNAKVTISGSLNPISDANPGIPISDEAVDYEIDTENTEEWHELECTLIHEMRYLAIRFEQDAYARVDRDDDFGAVARSSWYGLSEVKALGDGRHRYDKIIVDGTAYDHPDKGQVPYAEIKGDDDVGTVTAVPVAGTQITISNSALAVELESTGFMQVKTAAGSPELVRVTARSGDTLTISPAVVGVAIDDEVGQYNRWMESFDLVYHDLYYPQLRLKLENTTDWLEIIDDEDIAELEDAELSAVERLLEGVQITSDHSIEIPLDDTLEVGDTVRPYDDEPAFLITRCRYNLNSMENAETLPPVTQTLSGTSYFGDAQ
jgi:hypothetical protein